MLVQEKRGAIELSVTTIVIVVIGITLLTLGLRWITSTMEIEGFLNGQPTNNKFA